MRIDRSVVTLLGQAGIYASSASANALVAFFLVPFLTHYLSPSDYGRIETFVAASTGLTSIVIVGGNTMLTKEYFLLSREEVSNFTSEILGAIALAAFVLLLGAAAFALLANTGWARLGMSGTLLAIAVIVSLGNAIMTLLVTGYQLSKRAGLYAAFMNSRTVSELGLSVILVGVFGLAWRGRMASIVATSVLSLMVAILAFRSTGVRFSLPKRYARYILAAAPALVVASLTGWIHEMSDRFIVAGMVDLHATGLYSIAYRFGMVISVLETSFGRAWQPFFFEHLQRSTYEDNLRIVKASYLYIAALCAVTAVYAWLGPVLLRLMVSKSFGEAAGVVPIVSAGYCFVGIWKMFTGYLINAGRNGIYAAMIAFTAAVNIGASIFLVARFGYIGAAWGTFIAFAVGAMMTAVVAERLHPMPWLLRPRA